MRKRAGKGTNGDMKLIKTLVSDDESIIIKMLTVNSSDIPRPT